MDSRKGSLRFKFQQLVVILLLITMNGSFCLGRFLVSLDLKRHIRSAAFVGCSRRRLCNPQERSRFLSSIQLEIPTAEDTEEVGALFSALVLRSPSHGKGSTLFLDGDLGAGKTAFARGFLRAATGDDELLVTSPTYLLVNVYPVFSGALEIHHMDLYRLAGDPDDFLPLNLPHVFENCVSLIEWPQRLGKVPIPEDRLDINIRIQADSDSSVGENEKGDDDKPRIMTLHPRGPRWEERIQSIQAEGYLDDLIL